MKGSNSNNYHRCIYTEWKRRQGQHSNEWNVQEERNERRTKRKKNETAKERGDVHLVGEILKQLVGRSRKKVMGSQYIREVVRTAIAPTRSLLTPLRSTLNESTPVVPIISILIDRLIISIPIRPDVNRRYGAGKRNESQTDSKQKVQQRVDYLQLFLSLLYEYRDTLIRAVNCCVSCWLMVIEQRNDNDRN